MDVALPDFEDHLEPLGVAAGAFLVLYGLGTIAGQPWTSGISGAALVVTLLGSLLTAGVGVGLAWLAWTGRE